MLEFSFERDPKTHEEWVNTTLSGKLLLNTPLLNKGTAFSEDERHKFRLLGKLPMRVESLEEQATRTYEQYRRYNTDLNRHIFLYALHERNEVLFYKLVSDHLEEMMPIIYTPVVGDAVKQFSREFRSPRGLYISYPHQDEMADIINNRTHPNIDLIVVSDGSGVLGIGDQGVGGMDIPVAKLMVYTLCGGINPGRTLPIMLDVGTNNNILLNDPLYLGWKNERITGPEYDSFIDRFVETIFERFPDTFLHWEDFGRDPAHSILERYKHLCTFNDDIQGTGAVALAAILAGLKRSGQPLEEQRFVIYGAGAAGVGIADQITAALVRDGMPHEKACRMFWLLNSRGLITQENCTRDFQRPYARPDAELKDWRLEMSNQIGLREVVHNAKPTVLIGASAQAKAFSEDIIRDMAQNTKHPIIMPLSNPTERSEAHPTDLLEWTDGNALIATGSPFNDVTYRGKARHIAQSNNALIFPGLGLGVMAAKAKQVTNKMLWAACEALSELAPVLQDPMEPILPRVIDARSASYKIAIAVVEAAMEENLAQVELQKDEQVCDLVDRILWYPRYLPLHLIEK
jgi:malate dehydrogenase (oxaloacetate-decarboxylating)